MSDFFKSAFGYFSGNSSAENDFVGELIEVGNQKLRVKRVIAEGGFAYVYEAVDSSTGREYALKRLLSSDEATSKLILQEISYLKKLAGHPNIVKFVGAASVGKEKQGHVGTEFLLLTELCKGGQLVDLLRARGKSFPCDVVLQVMYQTCKAVQHMHSQLPPIIHRDLKVENLLLSDKNTVKLCDFGSCTTRCYRPDQSWTASQRGNAEDEIFRNTTPMYRAPEMLDLYQNMPITHAADIWALGCVLFLLCFYEHPFEDSAKLRIINGNYTIPPDDREYEAFHPLISGMLKVDPRDRPPIEVIVAELQEIATARDVKLTGAINFSSTNSNTPRHTSSQSAPEAAQPASNPSPSPPRPPPPGPQQPGMAGQAQGAGMFSMIRGGAGSLVRNLKDASNKMMETVSSSMSGRDLDFSYITTRVAVMSFPAEGLETAFRNHIEDVRGFLEARHPKQYAVYNLSARKYRPVKFDSRVSESAFNPRKAPPLTQLFAVCKNMHLWLRQTPKNICVVHCMDGKEASATVVTAFLCFCRLFDNPHPALQLFAARRCGPQLCASQIRYVEYICRMVSPINGGDATFQPHLRSVTLNSLIINTIPLFNKLKNGCRPFAEVYVGEKRILTTSQEYEKMRGFHVEDKQVVLPLNTSVCGDVTIIVYHARSTFGGKVQGKITSIRILQLQFHTGFVEPTQNHVTFMKHELDALDADEHKYSSDFSVALTVSVAAEEQPRVAATVALPWENFTTRGLSPRILFMDREEMRSVTTDYCRYNLCKGRPPLVKGDSEVSTDSAPSPMETHPDPAPDPPANSAANANANANFFETLNWGGEQEKAPEETVVEGAAVEDLLGFVSADSEPQPSQPSPPSNGHTETRDSPLSDEFELLNLRESVGENGASETPELLIGVSAMTDDHFDPFVSAFGSSGKEEGEKEATADWTADFTAFDPFAGVGGGEVGDGLKPVHSTGNISMGSGQATPPIFSSATSSPHHSAANLSAGSQQSVNQSGPSQQPATAPPQTKKTDPFADLGSFLSPGNKGKQRTDGGASPKRAPSPKPSERPPMGSGYRMASDTPSQAQNSPQRQSQQPQPQRQPQQPQPQRQPQQPQPQRQPQQQQQPQQPSYNRAHFAGPAPNNGGNKSGGVPPKMKQNAFEDLLGGFQGSGGFQSGAPRTINEMRKEKRAKTTDPDVMRVEEWIAGKERNIRALLCSLHQILDWEGIRWKELSMADLVSSNQVKKAYRKAVLDVHPDKTAGSPKENLARLVFIELSDAWTEFEEGGMKSLY